VTIPYARHVEDLTFRSWAHDDLTFLWDMLFQSLHVREGQAPFMRSVLQSPEIAHYLTDFGRRVGDDAQVCLNSDAVRIGAAWVRRMTADDPGYGYVGDDVPEVGMAVEASWRGRGIGRRLLQGLLVRHPAMSLSVDDDNPSAAGLYRSLGFLLTESVEGSTTMYRAGP
jgi:ribosomal protein S18 acetylase RimI-like enzyme